VWDGTQTFNFLTSRTNVAHASEYLENTPERQALQTFNRSFNIALQKTE
jgi:hypothetical protein